MSATIRAALEIGSLSSTPPATLERIKATRPMRKSSLYRFHDSARKDRKFMLAAVAAALLLAALLSNLGLDVFHLSVK